AGEAAFQMFKSRGISYADLSRLSNAVKTKGFAALTAEESALLRQVTKIHAEVAGATPASPLLSLTELPPEQALAYFQKGVSKGTVANRAYVVRVQVNPQDVARV